MAMRTDDPNFPPAMIWAKLEEAFPRAMKKVYETIIWDSLLGCWTINIHGMRVGIETDGYIHS